MAAIGNLGQLRKREVQTGFSKPARQVVEQVTRRDQEYRGKIVFLSRRHGAESQFTEFLAACDASEAPTRESIRIGYQLLESRAFITRNLEFAAEPDGGLGFDWLLGPHQLLSVGIDGSADLIYVWRNGSARGRGRCRFNGQEFPQELRAVLRLIYGLNEGG